jgi:hypothetical protein
MRKPFVLYLEKEDIVYIKLGVLLTMEEKLKLVEKLMVLLKLMEKNIKLFLEGY